MAQVVPVDPVGKQQSFLSTNIPFLYWNNPDANIPTYKHDYKPLCIKREKVVPKPTPVQVAQKDFRYTKEVQTEMMASYKPHPLQRMPCVSREKDLVTNFKMPLNSGYDVFVSTNTIFKSQKSQPFTLPPKQDRGASSLQKMQHVEKTPASTHQDSYTPPDHSSVTKRTSLCPDYRIPTIKGDGLPRSYETHYNTAFQGTPITEAVTVKKHSSSVVTGDKERIVERQSTHAASFTQPSVYSQSVPKELSKFNLGHTTTNSWLCTTKETFCAHKTDPVVFVKKNKNFSSVPEGDMDPRRAREMMSHTTSRISFTNMKPQKRPERDTVLMTKSNVHFSPAHLHASYYTTSNKEDYITKEDAERPRPATFLASHILSGPEHGPNLTIAQADFIPLASCKTTPSLSQRMTNIKFPVADQLYSTTHSEDYTAKSTSVLRPAKNQLTCNFVMQ